MHDDLAEYRRLAWYTMLVGLVMTAVLALLTYASADPSSIPAVWIGAAVTVAGAVAGVVMTATMMRRHLK